MLIRVLVLFKFGFALQVVHHPFDSNLVDG